MQGSRCGENDDDDNDNDNAEDISEAVQSFSQSNDDVRCFTVDTSNVYWMDSNALITAGDTRSRSETRAITRPPVPQVDRCSLARSGDDLFVATTDSNTIYRLSVKTEGLKTTLGETMVAFATFDHPGTMAQDDDFLYVIGDVTGEVRRIAKATTTGDAGVDAGGAGDAGEDAGTPDGGVASAGILLGTTGPNARDAFIDGAFLYWHADDVIQRVPRTGGAVEQLGRSSGVSQLVVAQSNLYWVSERRINTMPVAGGVPHSLPFTPADGMIATTPKGASTDDDDDVVDRAISDYHDVVALVPTAEGLLVGHPMTIGFIPFDGGNEVRLFRHTAEGATSSGSTGLRALVFDTSRYIWTWDRPTNGPIGYRPVLQNDPVRPSLVVRDR